MRSKGFHRISQTEIARELGVSQSLISKVLAGKNEASDKVRDRILAMVKKERYRPNALVHGLQTGHTNTVGVIVPAGGFHSEIVHGIHDCLDVAGYSMFLVWNKEDVAVPDSRKELEYIHRLIDRRVDGVILRPAHDDVSNIYFSEVWERGVPLVVIDRELSNVRCDFAGTDDEAGGRLAAEYLLSLGHRRLGQIAGPSAVSTAKDRRIGFEKAVAEFGRSAACRTIEAPTFANVKKEALQLMQSNPRPTAVFGVNDDAARDLFGVAATLGLRIPGDLSVVGFGDLPYGEYLLPSLTTFRQNTYGIGEKAAKLLLARCAGGRSRTAKQDRIRLKPELVIRGSAVALTN